jgi:hypothetical protein
MTYFRAAYNAIREVAPNITVVTAGLAPVGDVSGAVSDRRFLQQMYDAGLAQFPDVKVGVHPYGWGNPPDERCCGSPSPRGWADNRVFFFQDTLYDYIEIMQRNNHASKLWNTEFGWGTYRGVGPGGADLPAPAAVGQFELVDSKQQAEYSLRAFALLQQPPLSDWVEVSFLWNLNFALIGDILTAPQEQMGYSLLDASGYPRLIYRYFQVARKIAEP